jgi:hypothetical protein
MGTSLRVAGQGLAALVVASCASFDRCGGNAQAAALFDGSSLSGWREIEFGGGGEVKLEDGLLKLDFGSPLTGLVFTGDPPREDYELRVRAARLGGTDLFLGLTFPVGEAHASCVLGGWGGALCGLSCVDGLDASENATRSFQGFAQGGEVELVLRVGPDLVSAWLDGELLFEQARAGHEFQLRTDVLLTRPLGLFTYNTRTAISSVSIRRLD